MVDFRVALGFFQTAAQAFRFGFAGAHFGLEAARLFQHGLGEISQGRNDLTGLLDAREIGHLLFELVTVIRCRMPGGGRVLRECVECLLETYHQLLDLARRFIRLGSRGNLVEPRLRHGPAVRPALHDLAREPRIASASDAVGDHKIIRADLQAMIEQECSDLVQDMVARGKMPVLRVRTGARSACLVSAMPRSEPAEPFAWRSR